MKWLILSNSPYLNGGFQTLTLEFARSVLEQGGEVQFLCFQANPYRELAVQFPESCRFVAAPNIDTRTIRPVALLNAYRCLKQLRPDAIFFCNSGVPDFLPFMIAAKWAGVRHIVAHHGTDVDFPEETQRRRHFFGLIPGIGLWRRELIFACRTAFRRASLVLFNNEPQMRHWQEALRLPSDRCELWYPPLDLGRFGACEKTRQEYRGRLGIDDRYVVGCVGHLNRQKSFDVAIRAMSEFRRHVPNAMLLIAGEGCERSNLEALIGELDLTSHVTLLGDRSDIPQLMNAFDVFCLPSTRPNETLGIVILEAMATGLPVVVTDLPGPARLAQNGRSGMVVPTGDANALVAAWTRLHSNTELAQRLVVASQEQLPLCQRDQVLAAICSRLDVISPWATCRAETFIAETKK